MMKKWELKPQVSVGDIMFGMKREDVRKLFKGEYKEFKKSKYSKNTTDDFGLFHVFYTQDDSVEAVEIFEGIELILNNTIIFPISIDDIPRKIPDIEKDGSSYIHVKKSIGIETDDRNAESILVGAEGYYD